MKDAPFMDSRTLTAAATYARSLCREGALNCDDAALFAIIDFRRDYPITVESGCAVDEALADMVRLGLNALLVTRQEQMGLEQQILGLVTAHGLERFRRRLGREDDHSDTQRGVCVDEVMTPWNKLPLIRYESLESMTALQLYGMFRGTRVTHALVAETLHAESAMVRGLVSRASLAKRLRRRSVGSL